jgi:hypothetical protein
MLTLAVKLTAARRAVLGEELAQLNGTHRELQAAKKNAAKQYGAQISAVEGRSIPIEEALKMRGEKTVPLSVACEARPVDGRPDALDIYRMDTDPPSFVRQIPVPQHPEQISIPGMEPGTTPDQETLDKQFTDDITQMLGSVAFPDEEEDDAEPDTAGKTDAEAAGETEDTASSNAPPAGADDESDPFTD